MLVRPGSGRLFGGSESQVRRPMMTGCPVVTDLKCSKSSRRCKRHGIAPANDPSAGLRPDHTDLGCGHELLSARLHSSPLLTILDLFELFVFESPVDLNRHFPAGACFDALKLRVGAVQAHHMCAEVAVGIAGDTCHPTFQGSRISPRQS